MLCPTASRWIQIMNGLSTWSMLQLRTSKGFCVGNGFECVSSDEIRGAVLTVSSASTCPSPDQHPSTTFRETQRLRLRFGPHVFKDQRHESITRRNLRDYANTKLMSSAAASGGVWTTSQVSVLDVPRLSSFESAEVTWKRW